MSDQYSVLALVSLPWQVLVLVLLVGRNCAAVEYCNVNLITSPCKREITLPASSRTESNAKQGTDEKCSVIEVRPRTVYSVLVHQQSTSTYYTYLLGHLPLLPDTHPTALCTVMLSLRWSNLKRCHNAMSTRVPKRQQRGCDRAALKCCTDVNHATYNPSCSCDCNEMSPVWDTPLLALLRSRHEASQPVRV